LNRPKKQVYNARFLYHDSAHHGINRYPDRSSRPPSYSQAPFHTSSSSSFRSRDSQLSRKAPPKTQEYRFPNLSKTDIRGFDNTQRRDILMTPKTSETFIPVLDSKFIPITINTQPQGVHIPIMDLTQHSQKQLCQKVLSPSAALRQKKFQCQVLFYEQASPTRQRCLLVLKKVFQTKISRRKS